MYIYFITWMNRDLFQQCLIDGYVCCFQRCCVTHGAKIGSRYFKYLFSSFTTRKNFFSTLIELKQTLKFFLISFYRLICNYEYIAVMCSLKHISWNQATKCAPCPRLIKWYEHWRKEKALKWAFNNKRDFKGKRYVVPMRRLW